jgi:hypothetical protein
VGDYYNKPLGTIISIANERQRAAVRSYLLHSSLACVRKCVALLPTLENSGKMLGQNCFAEPNQPVLTFLHPILICKVTY